MSLPKGHVEALLFRFEVSVDDAVAVDVLKRQHELGSVETGHVDVEIQIVAQQGRKIPTYKIRERHNRSDAMFRSSQCVTCVQWI